MPRVKVALDRSFSDFTAAADWLSENGEQFTATSTAKHLYEEVKGFLEEGAVMNVSTVYSQKAK